MVALFRIRQCASLVELFPPPVLLPPVLLPPVLLPPVLLPPELFPPEELFRPYAGDVSSKEGSSNSMFVGVSSRENDVI